MSYVQNLNNLSQFSMDDCIRLSKAELPEEYRYKPWEVFKNIGHGTKPLSSELELCAYIAAYGTMHQGKGRAAFQNFNYDDLQSNFEIVDWGCGQGVATLIAIDLLKERDKIHLLRKVTLIEPSLVALERAQINVIKASGNITLIPINRYLPGDGTQEEVEGIEYKYSTILHLFSNVLDIKTIDLIKLARMLSTGGQRHIIICMGPKNTNSYRIEQFASIFNPSILFSNISNGTFGLTEDTHHIYSCVTKCFEYKGTPLMFENIPQYSATENEDETIVDDYDYRLLVQNNAISADLSDFCKMISCYLEPNDSMFVKPEINGDVPDVVIIRPNKGVLVVTLFERNLSNFSFDITDRNNKTERINHGLLVDNDDNVYLSPIAKVNKYKENLIKLHVENLLSKSLIQSSYWGIIHSVVVFSSNLKSEVDEFFEGVDTDYVYLLGKETLDSSYQDFFVETKMHCNNYFFDTETCNSFYQIVTPEWHGYR